MKAAGRARAITEESLASDHVNPAGEPRGNRAVPLGRARAMPPLLHAPQAFPAEEIAHVFSKEWRGVGRPDHAWICNRDRSLRGAPAMTLNEGVRKPASCTETVCRGLCAPKARAGHPGRLGQPDDAFARSLMGGIDAGRGREGKRSTEGAGHGA